MMTKQLLSTWSLLLVLVAIELATHGAYAKRNGSSHSMRGYTSKQSVVVAGATSANLPSAGSFAHESSSNDSSSGASPSSIVFPDETAAQAAIESPSTQHPSSTPQAPTEAPATTTPAMTSTTAPVAMSPVISEKDSSSDSQSGESSDAIEDTKQSVTVTRTPAPAVGTSSESANSDSTSSSSDTDATASVDSSSNDNDVLASAGPSSSNSKDDEEALIAQPGSDSSTFQAVASEVCSDAEIDNVYTLYSNCRSAFDLCVSASDYQIFPYQGKHPTQAQIQGMAESDACIAVFIVVIEANFSTCTIGGMPLVSAVETLLKISVDLAEGQEDEAPSAEVFQKLLTWRYEVDLAKAAGVPYDGSSKLYAEFETNLNAALQNTTIRVNEDLSVDVRLTNGSYKTFEDAVDLVVTDASAADLSPGYVIASSETGSSLSSSGSSSSTTGIVIESSIAVAGCTPTLWSLAINWFFRLFFELYVSTCQSRCDSLVTTPVSPVSTALGSPSLVGALVFLTQFPICLRVAGALPLTHTCRVRTNLADPSAMTMTSLLALLLAFLVVQASASGSGSLGASVGSDVNETIDATTSASPSSSSTDAEVTLAPIDTASSTSTTFQLVDNLDCNSTVSDKIYIIYNKNRALFDVCVSDAQYQIFPFLGTKPSAAQVKAMASSTSCIAVFTGVLLAEFPQCTISGFPLKAAVETLLKIHVDIVYGWAALPTPERFQEMMSWRRYVNLAKEAGVPYDSESELYAEYEENLDIARSNSSIRVLSNYQIEYKLASGSWYDADVEDFAAVGSTSGDSDDDTVGTVSAGDSSSAVSDSEASNVEENSAAAGNVAASVVAHGVTTAIGGLLLGVWLLVSLP
ncbi:unnamed protein product [Phytophthora lilii]|uniref:Unnamed protein product n=1 Tax=Phytophthora lilii TaxID=2077276 RepID=A0A9W6UAE9_9STRA|nr:unnamed protein product [Phytophthora lilii]